MDDVHYFGGDAIGNDVTIEQCLLILAEAYSQGTNKLLRSPIGRMFYSGNSGRGDRRSVV